MEKKLQNKICKMVKMIKNITVLEYIMRIIEFNLSRCWEDNCK